MSLAFDPIGTLRTCFPEKLGIPRQPGLVPLARGVLRFAPSQPPAVWRDCLMGMAEFSHVWITFVFDRAQEQGWKPRVRPPRLDGKEKMGVFATRSPHRPNFLGLSLCRLESVDLEEPSVTVSGVDILDGTPVMDLRPFHPENDVPVGDVARGWIARAAEPGAQVTWDEGVEKGIEPFLPVAAQRGMPTYSLAQAQALVEQVVGMDPRPAHLRGRDGDWYLRVLSFDVRVRMQDGVARIHAILP